MIDGRAEEEIRAVIGDEKVRSDRTALYAYGFDASIHRRPADLVVRPTCTEDVQAVVEIADRYRIPVIPRGAGTALCGQSVPIRGGIVLDMQGMNRILEIDIDDLICIVEPGVINDELNRALAEYGYFFPPTPGSGEVCTVGGMVAVNASGMRAVKYGATRDYVLGLEVVLPDANAVRLGSRTLKTSSGYQLERLFVGSEGTLGVITQITLKVMPLPKARAVAVAAFDTLRSAGEGVAEVMRSGILPSAIEIMDRVVIQAVKRAMNIGFPDCEALLMLECDGDPRVVNDDIVSLSKICREAGAIQVDFTTDPESMAELWRGRKGVLPSLSRYGENFVSVSLADDMCLPISRIPDAVVAFQEIARSHDIVVGTYGHAADGNLHTKVLLNPTSADAWRTAEIAVGEIYEAVLRLGGTVSGEHGVAITKAPYMRREKKDLIGLMRAVKRAIDPKNIMNPGKMMDWEKGIITHLRYPAGVKG